MNRVRERKGGEREKVARERRWPVNRVREREVSWEESQEEKSQEGPAMEIH